MQFIFLYDNTRFHHREIAARRELWLLIKKKEAAFEQKPPVCCDQKDGVQFLTINSTTVRNWQWTKLDDFSFWIEQNFSLLINFVKRSHIDIFLTSPLLFAFAGFENRGVCFTRNGCAEMIQWIFKAVVCPRVTHQCVFRRFRWLQAGHQVPRQC